MDYRIENIETLTENEAKEMAIETAEVKGHQLYFVDFKGYFGYSVLVFCNGQHIRYANDYELHHKGRTHKELKKFYLDRCEHLLFTEKEIGEPLKDYEEYSRKDHFLRNYYGMRVPYISAFFIYSDEERAKIEKKTSKMFYNKKSFAYYNDKAFVEHHLELFDKLEKAHDAMQNDFDYWKGAFRYEMDNHEYSINLQADFDVCSAFGSVKWHGDCASLKEYFDDLDLNDIQRKAYLEARKEHFEAMEKWQNRAA